MFCISFFFSSRRRHTRCALVTGVQTCALPICCTVREIPTLDNGDVDIEALKKVLGPKTAGIMLTNPSTIGVFERRIVEIAGLVHAAGGLLYYDGANLNAILGKVRPGDLGFRSDEHTSELPSLMRIQYAVFCLKKQ